MKYCELCKSIVKDLEMSSNSYCKSCTDVLNNVNIDNMRNNIALVTDKQRYGEIV